jgi:hypothetical protein
MHNPLETRWFVYPSRTVEGPTRIAGHVNLDFRKPDEKCLQTVLPQFSDSLAVAVSVVPPPIWPKVVQPLRSCCLRRVENSGAKALISWSYNG